jgi:hypothetical protein
MSTTIPIQDLDISISPPGNRRIHAVITLLWPYSSSTRQCALLLSERDFRLRARGGQIRVKFSGPAARAVADGRPGIGDEVVLELGSGEWAKDEGGVPVRVPGKSVGELQFGRGVSLTLKKNGVEDVEISVAEDAVDEVEEEEAPQVQATPRQKSNFRASFGGSPGSAAIYSSPAYMRKAAKYSYLDGISRLFEDEWDNQDLPRKKARTSIGDVKSWKMVDRTPSPERPSSGVAVQEDQEMGEADAVKDTRGDMEDPPAADLITSQVPPVGTPPPMEQEPITTESVEAVDPPTTARKSLEGQDSISLPATNLTSTLPRLQLPSASPTPQISQAETEAAPTIDPVTPRLVPLSSTTLPSTTPQISPLATKNAFSGQVDAGLSENGNDMSQVAEIPESHAEVEETTLASPKPITNNSLEQDQPAVTEHKSVAEVIAATTSAGPVTSEGTEAEDAPISSKSDDLAEEDAFSDDEADEVLSAYEKDEEMMYEDDAEDVFDADGLEGEEPSDDETIKDPEMHQSPLDDQSMEDAASEEDSDVEEPASDQSQIPNDVAAQPTASTPGREVYKQPSFTSASTLLRDEDTRAINTKSPVAAEQSTVTTPFKKPTFRADGVLPSTEVSTPVARTAETPNRTPQSVRDKVMKRTFSSLFGIKGTPSPEKEDPIVFNKESNGEEKSEIAQLVNEPSASEIDAPLNHRDRYVGLDGQSESEEAHSLDNVAPVNAPTDQASSPKDHDMIEVNDVPSVTTREMSEQHEDDEPLDASPRDKNLPESQPAELINLDSDSDEEAKVEEIAAEQVSDSHEPSPPVVAPTANERSDVESNAASMQQDVVDVTVPEPIVADAEQASSEHSISEQPQSPSPDHLEDVLAAPNDDNQDVTMLQPSEAPESVREDVFDVAMPESIPVDGEHASSEHNVPEQQQSLNGDQQEEQMPTPNDDEQDAPMVQSSGAPESVHASFIPDSMEQSAVSPDGTLSPEPEVQDTYPVEPEQSTQAPPEQSQPFDSVADVVELAHEPNQQTNGPETLPEILDSLPPVVTWQEQESRPASASPKKLSDFENDGQTKSVEVDDVDMLDAQERGHESPSLSFESQVEQDSIDAQEQKPEATFASFESQVIQESVDEQRQEPGSPLASFESQVVQDSVDVQQQEIEASASFESQVVQDNISAQQPEPEASLASFESQVVQESTITQQPEPEPEPELVSFESQVQESVDAQQQEPDSPLVSSESQVVQEAIDAQMSGMQEHSSRPVSRDTVEDFSPVQLGSFTQSISDVVSGTRAVERENETEVNDQAMLEQTQSDESESPAPSLFVGAMESPTQQDLNTPSRVIKHSTTVELEASPSSFGEFSPVRIDQSTNRQVLTPQATFPEEQEQEDDSMADETLIEQQLASEIIEEPVGSDTQMVENQLSAESMAQYRPLDGTSEQDEQASRDYEESTEESPAYPTLPISPSATKSQTIAAEPEARLSYASVDQTTVEPVSLTSTPRPTSSMQPSFDLETTKAPEEALKTPRTQQSEQEQHDMPPPEQPAALKTPARKSLRSRLSNVPDVISAWFSPKRSSVAARETERPTELETPAATADTTQNGSARKKHAGGIATAHTYFTKLASLERRLNPSGEQTSAVDVLAIVADSTKEPGRAKGGPRDYYTIFKIIDETTSSPVRVEVFRPWKAVLPAADVGDVILLRGFVVKSKKRQPYLLSTDSSAWCVWRFAEHTDNDGNVVVKEAEKSVRTRRMSHIDVREEVKGPPVEYGFAEKEEARKLRDWWIENHGDSQGGASSEEAVGNTHSEEADAMEL